MHLLKKGHCLENHVWQKQLVPLFIKTLKLFLDYSKNFFIKSMIDFAKTKKIENVPASESGPHMKEYRGQKISHYCLFNEIVKQEEMCFWVLKWSAHFKCLSLSGS
jgi:hypothetical protein